MTFIIITAMIVYFILIAWTWQSLGSIENAKKVVMILMGIILVYGITWIVFQTTKQGMDYQNIEMQNSVQNMLVAIFSGINGMIVMPQIAKILDKIQENEIEKEQLIKRIGILVIIFVICLMIERGYMRDTQEGILKVYYSRQ